MGKGTLNDLYMLWLNREWVGPSGALFFLLVPLPFFPLPLSLNPNPSQKQTPVCEARHSEDAVVIPTLMALLTVEPLAVLSSRKGAVRNW